MRSTSNTRKSGTTSEEVGKIIMTKDEQDAMDDWYENERLMCERERTEDPYTDIWDGYGDVDTCADEPTQEDLDWTAWGMFAENFANLGLMWTSFIEAWRRLGCHFDPDEIPF